MSFLGYKDNREFYTLLFNTAIPIAVQNAISSSLNLVDNVMIGQLGATSIAAVGLANQLFFLMTLILFGTYSGVSIFISQYWGSKNYDRLRDVMVVALTVGFIVATLFFFIAFALPVQFLTLLSGDPDLIAVGAPYLRIVSFSYLLTAVSFAFGFSTRGIGRAKLPMKASVISLLINTGLNALLIFGLFGFPELGVRGAAIATLIARIIECVIILNGIYHSIPHLAVTVSDFLKAKRTTYQHILKTAFPVIVNEGFWALGMTAYAYVYAHMGTMEMASIQISNMINSLFFVVSMGLGNAAMVMLGNKLGADAIDDAIRFNHKFLALSTICGVFVGIIIFTLSPFAIPMLFKLTATGYATTISTLRVLAFLTPFRFYNTIVIIGTLRSGGDTVFSMILELSCVWLIGVPTAFFCGFYLKLPVYYVAGFIGIEEISKALLGMPRVRSNKWAKRIVHT
jgi:putative MATE family efflux protein